MTGMPLSTDAPRRAQAPDQRGATTTHRGDARLRASLAWGTACCELSLAGALDRWSVAAVAGECDELLGADLREVVIDVTSVRRIDESGAVALAELWARLRSQGVGCRVRGLHPAFGDSPLELLLSVRQGDLVLPGCD